MPDHAFSEEIFSNIETKTPTVQLESMSSPPVTGCLGEDPNPHLITAFFQALEEL